MTRHIVNRSPLLVASRNWSAKGRTDIEKKQNHQTVPCSELRLEPDNLYINNLLSTLHLLQVILLIVIVIIATAFQLINKSTRLIHY